jgi:hypothetical protein
MASTTESGAKFVVLTIRSKKCAIWYHPGSNNVNELKLCEALRQFRVEGSADIDTLIKGKNFELWSRVRASEFALYFEQLNTPSPSSSCAARHGSTGSVKQITNLLKTLWHN